MRAVLFLYLTQYMKFSEDTSTAWFNGFFVISSVASIFGAMAADSTLGKFAAILIMSLLLLFGNVLLALTAIPGVTGSPPQSWGVIISIFLLAIGSGGLKPIVSAFGGEQYRPEQAASLQTFFAIYYFTINVGSLLSTVTTPKLRAEVRCFGEDTCYPLAFGLPALLMLFATAIFLFGKRKYVVVPPTSHVMKDTIITCWYVLRDWGRACRKTLCRSQPLQDAEPWHVQAERRFGASFLKDLRSVVCVMKVLAVIPAYWALSDQQGSTWTFQAAQLRTVSLGSLGRVYADQMQAVNSVLVLLLIPLMGRFVYPAIGRCRGERPKPLARMGAGIISCVIAFVVAGVLQSSVENQTFWPASLQRNNSVGGVFVVNTLEYPITVSAASGTKPFDNTTLAAKSDSGSYMAWPVGEVPLQVNGGAILQADVFAESLQTLVLTQTQSATNVLALRDTLPENDSAEGHGIWVGFRVINSADQPVTVTSQSQTFRVNPRTGTSNFTENMITPGEVMIDLQIGEYKASFSFFAEYQSLHTLVVSLQDATIQVQRYETYGGSDISILWQFPQYLFSSVGEVLFAVTGLEFVFQESPASLKVVMMSVWLLTDAVGNLIIIIITFLIPLKKHSIEFFVYASLLCVVWFLFLWQAWRYRYTYTGEESTYRSPLLVDPQDSSESATGSAAFTTDGVVSDPDPTRLSSTFDRHLS